MEEEEVAKASGARTATANPGGAIAKITKITVVVDEALAGGGGAAGMHGPRYSLSLRPEV